MSVNATLHLIPSIDPLIDMYSAIGKFDDQIFWENTIEFKWHDVEVTSWSYWPSVDEFLHDASVDDSLNGIRGLMNGYFDKFTPRRPANWPASDDKTEHINWILEPPRVSCLIEQITENELSDYEAYIEKEQDEVRKWAGKEIIAYWIAAFRAAHNSGYGLAMTW